MELPNLKLQTLEDYMQEIHAKNYHGTDDDMSDHYNEWLCDQGVDYVMQEAQEWGKSQFEAGRVHEGLLAKANQPL